jgi:antitoxin (DNA-binding transcriptional repressor) of toxin-antitoxin stability system
MYAMCYSRAMEVSITQFRRDLFALVNRALEGEEVWVAHRGRRFRIAPDRPSGSRLSRLTPLEVIDPQSPRLDDSSLQEEMERAWTRDWDEL